MIQSATGIVNNIKHPPLLTTADEVLAFFLITYLEWLTGEISCIFSYTFKVSQRSESRIFWDVFRPIYSPRLFLPDTYNVVLLDLVSVYLYWKHQNERFYYCDHILHCFKPHIRPESRQLRQWRHLSTSTKQCINSTRNKLCFGSRSLWWTWKNAEM
jgi:hypothetical protein